MASIDVEHGRVELSSQPVFLDGLSPLGLTIRVVQDIFANKRVGSLGANLATMNDAKLTTDCPYFVQMHLVEKLNCYMKVLPTESTVSLLLANEKPARLVITQPVS